MRQHLLMNCLWYQEITPEELADALELTPEALFDRIFRDNDFTQDEIRRIVVLLGLTEEEEREFFYD